MTPELSRLRSRIDDRTAKIVVVGQGYVGLPLAMRAAEVGYPVVGYDISPPRIDGLQAGRSYVEDVSDEQLQAALRSGLPAVVRRGRPRRLRRRRHHRADPAARGNARPLLHRGGRRRPGALHLPRARSSCSSRPPIPARPRSCCGRSSRRAACAAETDLFVGYSPERIDPGNTTWTFTSTAKVVSGIGPNSLVRRRGVLREPRRQDRPRHVDGRGRAHQAAREHLPARQHRARQRARDVRPRSRRRHLVGDRRGGHQALRLHALHARTGRRRALPADRSVVPRLARRTSARAPLPFRRARQRGQPGYARVRRRARHLDAQQGEALRQRIAHLVARARVQARHQRLARVARDDDRRAIARARRRPPRPRRARSRRRAPWAADHPRRLLGRRDRGRRPRVVVRRPPRSAVPRHRRARPAGARHTRPPARAPVSTGETL